MKNQRWSARKAAAALGVQHTFISRRLSGETPMDADDMEMFARLLNVDVAMFFARNPENPMQNSFWTIASVTNIDEWQSAKECADEAEPAASGRIASVDRIGLAS